MNPSSYPSNSRHIPESPNPSKVVHLRGVSPSITPNEIVKVAESCGAVVTCAQLRNVSQYLLQFQDINSATRFYNTYAQSGLRIRDSTIYVQYSIRQEISPRSSDGPGHSRILHVTISNVQYDINVNVLSQIFNQYDTSPRQTVNKLVIFQKMEDVQALIEFSSVEGAQRAKQILNGKNIYSNCCTLHIEDSPLQNLDVRENSMRSYDYTNPSLPQNPGPTGQSGYYMSYSSQGSNFQQGGPTRNPVVLVSKFPADRVGCDQLFNLFSNYGTIICIKILFNKPETALIQFSDANEASRAVVALRGIPMYGRTLDVSSSRHPFIKNNPGPDSNDPNTRNYDRTQNRSVKLTMSGQRNTAAPSDTLHISNISPTLTDSQLYNHFAPAGGIEAVKIYEQGSKKMALAKFKSVSASVEAMCTFHNSTLDGKTIRMSFTRNTI
ncbi:putative Polypyrimidine tract-binding protein [Blattamonas nauphoetae]|uniref:Polypyrimidine tract-binding protein n=1 Tax=Blattamonas nauphoetae TaxID=2049346 RepID=A0ABQ9WYE1_9EUKA|nr:putative Polypyrimidine tract-binding protein [Blattamonas nauphoetae]